jgi:hypothetical protein
VLAPPCVGVRIWAEVFSALQKNSHRIGLAHYMFEAFKRRHGRKRTMRELVEFAIAEVKDDRSRGIWRELQNGIANIEASRMGRRTAG